MWSYGACMGSLKAQDKSLFSYDCYDVLRSLIKIFYVQVEQSVWGMGNTFWV